jgi:hypothetical protein
LTETFNDTTWLANSIKLVTVLPPGPALTGGKRPRPEDNGKLLINPAGTIWQVIDGKARGYLSGAIFEQVHFWTRSYTIGQCNCPPWQSCSCVHVTEAVALTPINDLSDYIEDPPFDASLCLVSNSGGTVCLFESNVKRPIASAADFDRYQFDWSKVRVLPDSVYNGISTGPLVP